MDIRRVLIAALKAPKRFLDWVYTDTGRTRPKAGDVAAHVDAFGSGIATSRELQEAADARRRHVVAALDKDEDPKP